jgi:hypothetical protein
MHGIRQHENVFALLRKRVLTGLAMALICLSPPFMESVVLRMKCRHDNFRTMPGSTPPYFELYLSADTLGEEISFLLDL